ncbi:MAG: MBL fold metallo-hydrolase [Deltaproteobacteria bacterium]|nr:MBL fold metallo-hydrolase [Deltaproteobacteria bacterium]
MWISNPGKVSAQIDYLGTRKNGTFLLKGHEAMLIGGGMSWTAPALEKQFADLRYDPQCIRYLAVQHSHFDHCGAVPYLKRKFPHLQILASAYAQKVFANPKAMDFMGKQNQQMIEQMGLTEEARRLGSHLDGIQVDRVVKEGDSINLGEGIVAEFMEVPGHTKCAIAVYVPKLEALFPTDAVPFPTDDGREPSFPSPQFDYASFQASLARLAALPVKILANEHHGVLLGEEASQFIKEGLARTNGLKKYLMEEYQQAGGLDQLAQRMADRAMAKNKMPFMDRETQVIVSRTVAQKMLADWLPAKA